MNARTRHDYLFYQMASQNLSILLKLGENQEKKTDIYKPFFEKIEKNELSKEEIAEILESEESKRLMMLPFHARMYGIQTILNCAFCLESFINDYGSAKFGNSYFKDHLDKLDVKSKWLVIPQLATNNSIKKGGNGYQHLEKLVKIRNRLVHSKSKNIVVEGLKESEGLKEMMSSIAEAYYCFNGVKILLDELRSIDPDYEPISTYFEEIETGNSFFENAYNTMFSKSGLKKSE